MGKKKRTAKRAADDWRRDQQDPLLLGKMKIVGETLSILATICAVCFLFYHTAGWLAGCFGCILAALLLARLCPAYFTLLDWLEIENMPSYGIGLDLVVDVTGVALLTGQWYCVTQEWKLLVATGILAAAVLVILSGLREFQKGSTVLATVFVLAVCGYAAVNHANALLDPSEPHCTEAAVMETEAGTRGRGIRGYGVWVEYEGEKIRIPVSRDVYNRLGTSGAVNVARHRGALGIEYLTVSEEG